MTARLRLEGRDHSGLLGRRAARRLSLEVGSLAEGAVVSAEGLASVAPGTVEVLTSVGGLCTADDVERLLVAARVALAPGGRLRFVEHVGRTGLAGRVQAGVGPLWSRVSGGCHVDRDVPGAIRRAGFSIHSLDRFVLPSPVVVLRPWVRGVAAPVAA